MLPTPKYHTTGGWENDLITGL
ncbi:hypothetical protein SBA2_860003 [Acidobacteriia bacterium SbA2]|nr:hypothetical protein SBA2_860003 [Acidobacteriia bacterium SbA2]